MAIDYLLSEIDGGQLPCQRSVFSHIEQGLIKSPHKPAVICMHQPANHLEGLIQGDDEIEHGDHHIDCLKLTYTQLHRGALSLAAGLIEHGARPGSTVLSFLPNGGEYTLLYWTCALMRLTFSSPDPSILDPSNQVRLRKVLRSLKPGIIVVPDVEDARAVDVMIQDLDMEESRELPLRISSDKEVYNGWRSLREIVCHGETSPVDEDTLLEGSRNDNPGRVHSILYTSGTSVGLPKGAPMRVESMSHWLESQSWLINPENCSLVLQQAHNSRSIAQAVALQTWKEGGAIVMPSRSFAIEDTLEAITQHGVTWIVLSPAMVHALALMLRSRLGRIDTVKTIQVGGDTITKEILSKCASLFPNAKVCVNHGMSEGGGFFLWPFFDVQIAEIPFFGELCPLGTVAPGTRLRICDSGRLMKRGQPGELHVSCTSIIKHYVDGVNESSFYEDGKGRWFKTGDVAMVDDMGLVYILGRSKDVIKRGGTLITPAALESCLEKFTGAQTSVVAVPHPTLGHEPFAVLSNLNSLTEDDIKHKILRTFGRDYALRGAVSLKQLGFERFPVNTNHKVEKFEVQTAVIHYLAGLKGRGLEPLTMQRRPQSL